MTAFVATTATQMEVPTWVWYLTVGLMAAVLLFDVFIIARRPHVPSTKEVSLSLAFYIGAALLFGLGVWYFTHDQAGGKFATEYYAGWLTEYSLSVDNLFIFLLIMARFGVPEKLQQSALLIGIIIAITCGASSSRSVPRRSTSSPGSSTSSARSSSTPRSSSARRARATTRSTRRTAS